VVFQFSFQHLQGGGVLRKLVNPWGFNRHVKIRIFARLPQDAVPTVMGNHWLEGSALNQIATGFQFCQVVQTNFCLCEVPEIELVGQVRKHLKAQTQYLISLCQ